MAKLEKLEIKKKQDQNPRRFVEIYWWHSYVFSTERSFWSDKKRHRLRQKLDETGKNAGSLSQDWQSTFSIKSSGRNCLKEKELFKALEKELQTLEENIWIGVADRQAEPQRG